MRAAQSCWSEISVGFEFPLSLALQKRVDNLGAYRIPSETGFLIPSDLSSSAAIGDYIQARTAAWTQHLQRLRQRRKANPLSNENPSRKRTKKGSRKTSRK
jgi:hypothetical protein